MKYRRLSQLLKISTPLIIIGMHRSGTSMIAQRMIDFGIYMGRDINYELHAESRFWQHLNRKIMERHGGSWRFVAPVIEKMHISEVVKEEANKLESLLFDECYICDFLRIRHRISWYFGIRPFRLWGWKDPRSSITLPVWLSLFPKARVIHIIRNGIDSAISLHRRETKENPKNQIYNKYSYLTKFYEFFRLWEDYVYAIFNYCKVLSERQYFEIRYEDILRNPSDELKSILSFIKFPVSDSQVNRVSRLVDSARLNNSVARNEYKWMIEALPKSSLMAKLGYEQRA